MDNIVGRVDAPSARTLHRTPALGWENTTHTSNTMHTAHKPLTTHTNTTHTSLIPHTTHILTHTDDTYNTHYYNTHHTYTHTSHTRSRNPTHTHTHTLKGESDLLSGPVPVSPAWLLESPPCRLHFLLKNRKAKLFALHSASLTSLHSHPLEHQSESPPPSPGRLQALLRPRPVSLCCHTGWGTNLLGHSSA